MHSSSPARAGTHGGLRDYTAACTICGAAAPRTGYQCLSCAGPLLLHLEPVAQPSAQRADAPGLWRRRNLLPKTAAAITLGEAQTPLLDLGVLPDANDAQCWAKAEYLNPTLSFKDRAMALGVSHARDAGAERIVLASTGNAAVSAAAYSAAAGLPCSIFCADGSHAARQLAVAKELGAQITVVHGDYSDAYAAAESPATANLTTTYRNPILAEAYRTISAEIVQDLGDAPNVVVVPVGAGPLVHGLAGGFHDACTLGEATRMPRLVGVQAAACAPLATAWGSDDWATAPRRPVQVRPTAATAIADSLRGYEDQGLITLAAVRRTHGAVIAVTEDAISNAQDQLRQQGILVEPASATTLAALAVMMATGLVSHDARVVLILTGHGDVMQKMGSDP